VEVLLAFVIATVFFFLNYADALELIKFPVVFILELVENRSKHFSVNIANLQRQSWNWKTPSQMNHKSQNKNS
jgi:hypothetical protein